MSEKIDRNGDRKSAIEKAMRESQGVSRGPEVVRLDVEIEKITFFKRFWKAVKHITNVLYGGHR